MKNSEKKFNEYTSLAVIAALRNHGMTYGQLQQKTGISTSFIKEASSRSGHQHWNAFHLYKISQALNDPVNLLYPSKKHYFDVMGPNAHLSFTKFRKELLK